jgi:hypothetical protein
MANYDLMILWMKSVDNDIKYLAEKKGSKSLVKLLIKLQEYSRAEWAKIHSIVKTMDNKQNDVNFEKSQKVINSVVDFNIEINKFYDNLVNLCIDKKIKGNEEFLNYVLEEMYFKYSIFLDAIHFMGIYYICAESFPFALSNVFANRKLEEFENGSEYDNDINPL